MGFKKLLLKEQEPAPDYEVLLPRELEIAKLAAIGLDNQEISEKLGISKRTVQAHLFSTFKKCQVNSRTALVIRLIKEGLIKLEEIQLIPSAK